MHSTEADLALSGAIRSLSSAIRLNFGPYSTASQTAYCCMADRSESTQRANWTSYVDTKKLRIQALATVNKLHGLKSKMSVTESQQSAWEVVSIVSSFRSPASIALRLGESCPR